MVQTLDLFLDLLPLGLLSLGLLESDTAVFGVLVFNLVGFLEVTFSVLGGESWRVGVLALMKGVVEDPEVKGPTEARIVTYKNEENIYLKELTTI